VEEIDGSHPKPAAKPVGSSAHFSALRDAIASVGAPKD